MLGIVEGEEIKDNDCDQDVLKASRMSVTDQTVVIVLFGGSPALGNRQKLGSKR